MPRGRRTDLQRAATAKAMHEMRFQTGQIGEAVGLPEATVDDIVRGRHGWSKMLDDPVFREYRVQQKRFMQVASIELAKKALRQIEDKLPKTSAVQGAMIYGILRDKERLDAGEAAENAAHIHKYDLKKLDILAERLSQSLLAKEEPTKDGGES